MPFLFAHPYNHCATGFYFDCEEDYKQQVEQCVDGFGSPVEEFEIQFIDGEDIDFQLFEAWQVDQGNFEQYLDAAVNLEDHQKLALIALGKSGYILNQNTCTDDVELHYCDSLKDLAMQFVEEGLYGAIPDSIWHYIDYDAMARDLGYEYTSIKIGNEHVIYRCP